MRAQNHTHSINVSTTTESSLDVVYCGIERNSVASKKLKRLEIQLIRHYNNMECSMQFKVRQLMTKGSKRTLSDGFLVIYVCFGIGLNHIWWVVV